MPQLHGGLFSRGCALLDIDSSHTSGYRLLKHSY